MEPHDALEELVAACIEAVASGDLDAVENLLAAHPDLAGGARAQLDDLARSGLLEDHPCEIGPYRILEPLGQGGMGAVYLAEQRSPVVRRVALKLVKRGMDTREVLARFAAERQALALMSHPNIAKVFDAGSTPDGRPYFVMEHVAGLPITEYCERKRLDTDARIELVLQICDGVQHAHHKGVVHRDLKPSNLLVAEQDGRPVPKIIDFGIAKAVDRRLGGATLHTAQGVVLGTPEYMSPEQAGRDALDVDLRTDVWSLGVVLYELLAGELPFLSARLRTDPAQLQRVLREEEPPTPSRRLQTRSRERGAPTADLVRRLRGDLDWICMKALEKDRERRYATVSELAADLRRHLACEPVLAGPPSRVYRCAKFVRRNRLQVGAALLVLVALVGGLAASLVYQKKAEDAAARATQALADESAARDAAERDFRSALEAVDVLLTRVADARLEGVPQMDEVRRALLEDAARLYRRLLEARRDDPKARYQSASSRVALARVLSSLGESKESLAAAQAATAELDALVAAAPGDREVRFQRAQARDALAQAMVAVGQGYAARPVFASALDDYRALLAEAPDDLQVRRHLVGQLHNLAYSLRDSDRGRALALWNEARRQLEPLRAAGGDTDWGARTAAVLETGLAGALLVDGDAEAAEDALERARTALAHFDLGATWDVELLEAAADAHRKLGVLRYRSGRIDEAVAAARGEIAAAERLTREHPDVPAYRAMLASAFGNLAVFRAATALDGEALDAFRHAADALEGLATEFPDDLDYRRSLAVYSGNLARALLLGGRRADLAEARRRATRALELARQEPDATPGKADRLVDTLVHLADIEAGDGRADEAWTHATEALAIARAVVAADAGSRAARATLATAAETAAQLAIAGGAVARARAPLDEARAACAAVLARSPADFEAQQQRARLSRLDALAAVEEGQVERAVDAASALPAAFGEGDAAHGLAARAEVLSRAHDRAPDPGLAGEAEDACRAALARLDVELAAAAEDRELARLRAELRVALAELCHARGDGPAATALLDPAIAELRAVRAERQVDPVADERLAQGLRLRAAIARAAGDTATAEASARALADEFGDAPVDAAHRERR